MSSARTYSADSCPELGVACDTRPSGTPTPPPRLDPCSDPVPAARRCLPRNGGVVTSLPVETDRTVRRLAAAAFTPFGPDEVGQKRRRKGGATVEDLGYERTNDSEPRYLSFKDFYAVPDYQREYVWEAEEVEQLLTDIRAEMGSGSHAGAPEYFIGSIVICPGKAGVLDLIDGQQRMTTLYLTLCAIRDHLQEIGDRPPGALGPQVEAVATDESGRDHSRYRFDLQYEDSGDVLVEIARGESRWRPEQETRSIRNILNAYASIREYLKNEFGGMRSRFWPSTVISRTG
jgi:hypothetical protein